MSGRSRPALFASCLWAFGVLGCDWDESLRSDATAWTPAARPVLNEGGAGASIGNFGCNEDPPHDPNTWASREDDVSHRSGEACLGSCHVDGGSARTTFEAAGTAYVSEDSRQLAAAGSSMHAVGGTTLVVDRCGNFYAIRGALQASTRASQPFVNDPILRKMEKAVHRLVSPGDCNMSGCHDFSAKGTSGIFY